MRYRLMHTPRLDRGGSRAPAHDGAPTRLELGLAAAAERSACKCVGFAVHLPRNPR
jgi:hypothetical protein